MLNLVGHLQYLRESYLVHFFDLVIHTEKSLMVSETVSMLVR
jgi:hypothetical protein